VFNKEIISLLNMSNVTITKLKNEGVEFESICNVLKSQTLSIREKKTYLYGLNYDEFIKDRIWEGYMGDIKTAFFKRKNKERKGKEYE